MEFELDKGVKIIIDGGALSSLAALLGQRTPALITSGGALALFSDNIKPCFGSDVRISAQKEGDFSAAENADVIVGFGSGRVAERTKEAALKTNKPYIIAATAASTDSYTNPVLGGDTPWQCREVKRAEAVIFDTDIISTQPREMSLKCLGTMLAREVELADRRVTAVMSGQKPSGEEIALASAMGELLERKEPSPALTCEILAKTGSMLVGAPTERGCVGQTLSAISLFDDTVTFDGIDEGFAAILCYRTFPFAYAGLRARMRIKAREFHAENWRGRMQRKLGPSGAERAEALEKESRRHEADGSDKRIETVFSNAPALIETLKLTPDLVAAGERFFEGGGMKRLKWHGHDARFLKDALKYGRELSLSYGVTDLLWDLDRLSEAAKSAVAP